MDEADMAQDSIEAVVAAGMARAKNFSERQLLITGQCLWCAEEIVGRPFCSKECSVDWQAAQDAKRRNGK